jgi:hypothetical protein
MGGLLAGGSSADPLDNTIHEDLRAPWFDGA